MFSLCSNSIWYEFSLPQGNISSRQAYRVRSTYREFEKVIQTRMLFPINFSLFVFFFQNILFFLSTHSNQLKAKTYRKYIISYQQAQHLQQKNSPLNYCWTLLLSMLGQKWYCPCYSDIQKLNPLRRYSFFRWFQVCSYMSVNQFAMCHHSSYNML